jgi:hypothetical protein
MNLWGSLWRTSPVGNRKARNIAATREAPAARAADLWRHWIRRETLVDNVIHRSSLCERPPQAVEGIRGSYRLTRTTFSNSLGNLNEMLNSPAGLTLHLAERGAETRPTISR